MLLLTRAFICALKAPPIAPSALSDFRAVGRGGASRRLYTGGRRFADGCVAEAVAEAVAMPVAVAVA